MKYRQIDVETTIEGLEPVVGALIAAGFANVEIHDPRDIEELLADRDSYRWDYVDSSVENAKNETPKVRVYLEEGEETETQIAEISGALSDLRAQMDAGLFGEELCKIPLDVSVSLEDDSEWRDSWKEYFKPVRIGSKIVVKPTWQEYEAKEGDCILEIDPGMAFGTGTHETTSLCIKLMEKYMAEGDKVLDVGCGSGILSIAGVMLGAGDVLGVDIDPVAVEVSKENIILNGVEKIAVAQIGDLTAGIDYKANVVVANLMADLVVRLTADVAKHLLPEGRYISSGILVEKEAMVCRALEAEGFEVVEVLEDGMWCAVVARVQAQTQMQTQTQPQTQTW